jgi:hypothetical protein
MLFAPITKLSPMPQAFRPSLCSALLDFFMQKPKALEKAFCRQT